MNLQGSITELQDTIVKLYVELEHHFNENQLIRDLWSAMAHDITQQKRSMGAIPHSFWHQLKDEQDRFSQAISQARQQTVEIKEDISLRDCIERALLHEEPVILKVYVPIIRKLRENSTDHALDFYIMVKAHLARIARVTQAFAGDPVVIQRSNLLLQSFEKEVQEPQPAPVHVLRKAHVVPASHLKVKEKHPAKPQKKVSPKKAPVLAKHGKSHRSRTKSLVEKINLRRRRARR